MVPNFVIKFFERWLRVPELRQFADEQRCTINNQLDDLRRQERIISETRSALKQEEERLRTASKIIARLNQENEGLINFRRDGNLEYIHELQDEIQRAYQMEIDIAKHAVANFNVGVDPGMTSMQSTIFRLTLPEQEICYSYLGTPRELRLSARPAMIWREMAAYLLTNLTHDLANTPLTPVDNKG